MPGERHVTLQYQGFKLIYPPQPGKYSAETDGGKVLLLHVHFPDSGNPNGDKPALSSTASSALGELGFSLRRSRLLDNYGSLQFCSSA